MSAPLLFGIILADFSQWNFTMRSITDHCATASWENPQPSQPVNYTVTCWSADQYNSTRSDAAVESDEGFNASTATCCGLQAASEFVLELNVSSPASGGWSARQRGDTRTAAPRGFRVVVTPRWSEGLVLAWECEPASDSFAYKYSIDCGSGEREVTETVADTQRGNCSFTCRNVSEAAAEPFSLTARKILLGNVRKSFPESLPVFASPTRQPKPELVARIHLPLTVELSWEGDFSEHARFRVSSNSTSSLPEDTERKTFTFQESNSSLGATVNYTVTAYVPGWPDRFDSEPGVSIVTFTPPAVTSLTHTVTNNSCIRLLWKGPDLSEVEQRNLRYAVECHNSSFFTERLTAFCCDLRPLLRFNISVTPHSGYFGDGRPVHIVDNMPPVIPEVTSMTRVNRSCVEFEWKVDRRYDDGFLRFSVDCLLATSSVVTSSRRHTCCRLHAVLIVAVKVRVFVASNRKRVVAGKGFRKRLAPIKRSWTEVVLVGQRQCVQLWWSVLIDEARGFRVLSHTDSQSLFVRQPPALFCNLPTTQFVGFTIWSVGLEQFYLSSSPKTEFHRTPSPPPPLGTKAIGYMMRSGCVLVQWRPQIGAMYTVFCDDKSSLHGRPPVLCCGQPTPQRITLAMSTDLQYPWSVALPVQVEQRSEDGSAGSNVGTLVAAGMAIVMVITMILLCVGQQAGYSKQWKID